MNKLQLAIATLAVSLAVVGCNQQNNPVESSTPSGKGFSSLAKGRIFPTLDLISKPPVKELKKNESDAAIVVPDKKVTLKSKFQYTTYSQKTAQFDATLTIDKGSVTVPTNVTLGYDTSTGAIVVGPPGVQFLKAASLDVQVTNLDPFADNSTVYFVAVLAGGGFEEKTNQELIATGNNGKIKMKGGEIWGADVFLFGRNIEMLSIPAIGTITKEDLGSVVIVAGHDATVQAKLEYVSTNGNKVTLGAEMKISKDAVDPNVVITMKFDRSTGRVVFGPEGLQFRTPGLLDVKMEGSNSFVNTGIEFVYVMDDGTYEAQIYKNMVVDGSKGKVEMTAAQINHFSMYAFGRVTD